MKVLVYGDLMLDHYLVGESERTCPDAPGAPVVRQHGEHFAPGGAANVALCLKRLGHEVTLVGLVGGGTHLLDGDPVTRLDSAGLRLSGLVMNAGGIAWQRMVEDGRPTTTKTRVQAGGRTIARIDREWQREPGHATISPLAARLRSLTDLADVLVVSDYGKGAVTHDAVAAMQECGKPTYVDPCTKDGRGLLFYDMEHTALKVNAHQASELLGHAVACTPDGLQATARCLDFGCMATFVTAGEEGAAGARLLCHDYATAYDPALAEGHCIDPQGAGDAFLAGLVHRHGMNLGEQLQFASACSAAAVVQPRTHAPALGEVEAWLEAR